MDFTGRLVDTFFRRWYFFIIPVLLFGALGASSAMAVPTQYASESKVNASRNPLVAPVEIRGVEIGPYESAAGGTARLVNEQLRTDAFVDRVVTVAGLEEVVAAGGYSRNQVRGAVGAIEAGQSVLLVRAFWDDPQVAYGLVEGTLQAYREHLAQVVTSDSIEAIDFWRVKESDALEIAEQAEVELLELLDETSAAGDDNQRAAADQLAIARLEDTASQARDDATAARGAINEAELAVERGSSDSSLLLQIVDPASVPAFPEPKLKDQVITLGMFLVVGLIVAAGGLLVVTALDRTVRSPMQLAAVGQSAIAVSLPYSKAIRRRRSRPVDRSKAA